MRAAGGSASAAVFVADAVSVRSPLVAVGMMGCALAAFATLCIFAGFLDGRTGAPLKDRVMRAAPGIVGRCALILGSSALVVLAYGILAFLLDLSLFPHIGTQAALMVLESLAMGSALGLAPLPLMLLAGCALAPSPGFHPIRDMRSMRGAYVPVLAASIAAVVLGILIRAASSLIPHEGMALMAFILLSWGLGAVWIFATCAACVRTRAVGATATVSCILTFALAFSLLGMGPAAFAEEGAPQPGPAPVEPDVYEVPDDIAPSTGGAPDEDAPSPDGSDHAQASAGEASAPDASSDTGAPT